MKYSKIVIIIVCSVWLVFIAYYFNRSIPTYILIDGYTTLKYEKGKYKEESYNQFINKKMKIYDSNVYKGEYLIRQNADSLLMPSDFNFSTKYIGFHGDNPVEVANFSKQELSSENLKKLDEILKKHKIYDYTSLVRNEQIVYDIDNDNIEETIISVANYSMSNDDDNYFNFVYVIDNDEIYYLVEEIYDGDDSFIGNYEIRYLICPNNKKKYDIILYFSDWDKNYYTIYSKEKNIFEKKL